MDAGVLSLFLFIGLASRRMLVEREGKGKGKKKQETESDSSKSSCRRKGRVWFGYTSFSAMNGHCTVVSWPMLHGAMAYRELGLLNCCWSQVAAGTVLRFW